MNKNYRFVGKKGRITIPLSIRRMLNIKSGDLLGFSVDDSTVIITKEKICDRCIENKSIEQLAEILTPSESELLIKYIFEKYRKAGINENTCS